MGKILYLESGSEFSRAKVDYKRKQDSLDALTRNKVLINNTGVYNYLFEDFINSEELRDFIGFDNLLHNFYYNILMKNLDNPIYSIEEFFHFLSTNSKIASFYKEGIQTISFLSHYQRLEPIMTIANDLYQSNKNAQTVIDIVNSLECCNVNKAIFLVQFLKSKSKDIGETLKDANLTFYENILNVVELIPITSISLNNKDTSNTYEQYFASNRLINITEIMKLIQTLLPKHNVKAINDKVKQALSNSLLKYNDTFMREEASIRVRSIINKFIGENNIINQKNITKIDRIPMSLWLSETDSHLFWKVIDLYEKNRGLYFSHWINYYNKNSDYVAQLFDSNSSYYGLSINQWYNQYVGPINLYNVLNKDKDENYKYDYLNALFLFRKFNESEINRIFLLIDNNAIDQPNIILNHVVESIIYNKMRNSALLLTMREHLEEVNVNTKNRFLTYINNCVNEKYTIKALDTAVNFGFNDYILVKKNKSNNEKR